MKFKLDENLPVSAGRLLANNGHDVATVHSQSMAGSSGRELIARCTSEQRCIATLDVEFGNPRMFPPTEYAGIALVRLPSTPTHDDLTESMAALADAIRVETKSRPNENPIAGKLWIAQPGRVRVYQDPDASGE